MNDAQTWTAIGGLLVAMFTFAGLVVLESKVDAGFDRLDRRIDGVDRDVAALTRRHLDGG